jgi:hypothetical protein
MEKCIWCGGIIIDKLDGLGPHCLMCARSPDIDYELYVMKEKSKEHRNWHSYQTKTKNKREEDE